MDNGGLLAGIMNPAQVDVLGSMDKGRERQADQMAGNMLGDTLGGQFGKLARVSFDKAMAYAKATNTPTTDMGRIQNLMGTQIMVAKLWDAGDKDNAISTMQKQIQLTEERTGQEATNLRLAFADMQAGGGEVLNNFLAGGRSLDPTNKQPSAKDQSIIDLNKAKTADIGKVADAGIDKDFLKEERQAATSTTSGLRKRASVISSSIGKIEGLIPQVKAGSRAAAGGAIMSLARLVSPGVVTEGDFQAMSGAADPVATLMARLTEKGDSGKPLLEALQAAYDPTNPDLIDADAILNIAKSVVSAEVPSILQEYKEADSRARRSGMNQRQYNTIFGDSESITGLSRYVSKSGKYQVEEVK